MQNIENMQNLEQFTIPVELIKVKIDTIPILWSMKKDISGKNEKHASSLLIFFAYSLPSFTPVIASEALTYRYSIICLVKQGKSK